MYSSRQNRPRDRQARNLNSNRGRKIRDFSKSRRTISPRSESRGFDPPEEWHEPTGAEGYRVIVRKPGVGYRHVVTPQQVRSRLARLPKTFLKRLELVQLSQMTRKKEYGPCYGLQWGSSIYLYPFDNSLEELFCVPPPQPLVIESKMFGGRWDRPEQGYWRLKWTESAARDFLLNNVLIHELGHLLDDRNTSYLDQERFAEWFAIEYGYRYTGGLDRRQPGRKTRRRHHG